MGRSNTKLPLELIKNEKSRNVTFRKRKKGLMKKTYELNKLCDVQCSVIIYENKNGQLVRPDTYPENPEEVKQIIDRFVSKSAKALFPNNNVDYSQMVALNQYLTSGSMMYTSDSSLPEEQTNLQALFQNNLINFHQNYNYGSIMTNGRNGMPWQSYSIQSAPSASNGSNYDEQSTSMKCENHLQYGNINENLTVCNHVPPQQTVYPMSASYLFDNANQFLHLKG
ncbi:agamous-like MADS-box protein AGL27 [Rosa rugosa]|uniref:agamous-like MADS-box protein AGL27 n=1 Tax=Rosa rugosa TaxID=74645 RepID=UPI002B410D92|nr:agamous-like MADS-box protein AGL27 [Rosa rugosa]